MRRRGELAASRVTLAEVAAAIARAHRDRRLDDAARRRVLDGLQEDFPRLRVVEVRRAIVERAADLIGSWPLRAYDAIQLASALALREAGGAIDFWCSDEALGLAAAGEGLRATRI